MSGERRAFAVAAWIFLGAVIVQVFLAGLGAFKVTDWTSHAGFGWLLGAIPFFVLLPLSFVADPGRSTRWLTVALAVSTAVQPELAAARTESPVIAALHPVNAMLIFWLAWKVARASLREERRPASTSQLEVPGLPADGTTLPTPPANTAA